MRGVIVLSVRSVLILMILMAGSGGFVVGMRVKWFGKTIKQGLRHEAFSNWQGFGSSCNS